MTRRAVKDTAASVKGRLLALARDRREDFHFLLTRYGLERLLYRLARSPQGGAFVLKGAMLFAVWSGKPHRATKDLDLLSVGSPDLTRLEEVFRVVCATPVEDDGLVLDGGSVRAQRIKEGDQYEGVRVSMSARLGVARISLQVDVGFGDAMVPGPEPIEYPTLLPVAAPRLRAYRRETVIAEKLQAMVHLGLANSRMKDFYDVWFLSRAFPFDGELLTRSIHATFERRGTAIPPDPPIALTSAFSGDRQKASQWRAFVGRVDVLEEGLSLAEVVEALTRFAAPPLDAARRGAPFAMGWEFGSWSPTGGDPHRAAMLGGAP